MSIPSTKGVPISGIDNVEVGQSISSGDTPIGSVEVIIWYSLGSHRSTSITGIPVASSRNL